jgi:ABC-type antimicrobial peptide transport system ATPase subunit
MMANSTLAQLFDQPPSTLRRPPRTSRSLLQTLRTVGLLSPLSVVKMRWFAVSGERRLSLNSRSC